MTDYWYITEEDHVSLHPVLAIGLLSKARHGVIVINYTSIRDCMLLLPLCRNHILRKDEMIQSLFAMKDHPSDLLPVEKRFPEGSFTVYYKDFSADDIMTLMSLLHRLGEKRPVFILVRRSEEKRLDFGENTVFLKDFKVS